MKTIETALINFKRKIVIVIKFHSDLVEGSF